MYSFGVTPNQVRPPQNLVAMQSACSNGPTNNTNAKKKITNLILNLN